MRNVAKKMREKTEELEADLVDVRKEDKTIRPFYHSVSAGNCRERFENIRIHDIKKAPPTPSPGQVKR